MRSFVLSIALLLPLAAAENSKYLFREPALSRTHVVFGFAGDLWRAPRSGGSAERITSGPGRETGPLFSPDGQWIAFTGEYDGNIDVFVMPASGGVPKRLTAHPTYDLATGWTPDSKRVLFHSNRNSHNYHSRLFTVSIDGGLPEELPLPIAYDGALSPDGKRLAYLPTRRANLAWKRYRGGTATPIWIASLEDSSVTRVPRTDSNESYPMWAAGDLYFLSDREGSNTLYRYDDRTRKVVKCIPNTGLDIKSASAGPDAIVYEQFGGLHLYDLKSGKAQPVAITINADLLELRPRREKVVKFVQDASLSPSGARAVFSARGDIFTVPAQKGNARNLTATPGIAERDPSWSPDGKWIAYFSDESGEYRLHVRPQDGEGEIRKLDLGTAARFYYSPRWSPDSKKIAYWDKSGTLWYLDIEKGAPVRIDQGTYQVSRGVLDPDWSPDSKWIAYGRQLKTMLTAIHVYSLESGQSTALTDGLSDARSPRFDRGGKYLYFAASTDSGPTLGDLDLSAFNRPVTRTVYVTVLSRDAESPLKPESDEETAKKDEEKDKKDKDAGTKPPAEVKIDFAGIGQRTIPLPLPARNYSGMEAGKPGVLFLAEAPLLEDSGDGTATLHRFDLDKRKSETFASGIRLFLPSANGEKILLRSKDSWRIAETAKESKPDEGRLNLDDLEMQIDPKAEWAQIFREAWRLERDYFYDPSHHGLDLAAHRERYETFLPNLASRADLNYLFQEMWGELSVGHLYVGGGDQPEPKKVKGGLLGADYRIESGRYRISKVYSGENWNPETRAPLTQPGVNVSEGEYILAVNGRELRGTDEIHAQLEGTAGRAVRLKVGPDPGGAGSREVTVVPLESESQLRVLDWIEGNRRKVAEKTAGRVAYVHLPDTHKGGYTYFNRYYYAQTDKQGLIVDERFNRGGKAADYVVDTLNRRLLAYWSSRDGGTYSTPATAIFGPKVMIINNFAGSGGDLLPWFFRKLKLGPLIGTRTWGGLVGIGGYPDFIDGGSITAPHFGFWNPEGSWEVENKGVPPDIEVDLDPKAWRQGRDTQLEKAIEVVLAELEKNPPREPKTPPYPRYHGTSASPSGNGR